MAKDGSKSRQAPPPLFKPAALKPKERPAPPDVSELPVDVAKIERAVKALFAHVQRAQEEKQQSDLLGGRDEKVFLVIGLVKPPAREQHKPVRLPVPNPVIDPRESPVTLFVKDPQRQYKDLLADQKIEFVSRVVGLDKLRNKHKSFEAKRALLKEAEMFLVDDRVMIEVSHCLGKMWRQAKKQPVPVTVSRKDLKGELERAISSAYLQLNTGTSLSVRLGSASFHTPEQLAANLVAIVPQLAVLLPNGGFDNVQSLHIKSSTSTSLPVYEISDDKRFAGPSQDELEAIERRRLEKEQQRADKEARREQRRKEKSATKQGKGRLEKGDAPDQPDLHEEVHEAPAKDDDDEEPTKKKKKRKAPRATDRDYDEFDLPLDQPIVAEGGPPQKKKVKKSSKRP